jgi:hypothetical protein
MARGMVAFLAFFVLVAEGWGLSSGEGEAAHNSQSVTQPEAAPNSQSVTQPAALRDLSLLPHRRAVLFVTVHYVHTPTHTNARQREGPASTCLPSAPRTPRTPQRSVSPSPRAAQGQLPRGGSFGSRSSHAPSWSSSSSRSTHGRASMSPRRSPGNLLLHADRASRCASPCLAPQHPR